MQLSYQLPEAGIRTPRKVVLYKGVVTLRRNKAIMRRHWHLAAPRVRHRGRCQAYRIRSAGVGLFDEGVGRLFASHAGPYSALRLLEHSDESKSPLSRDEMPSMKLSIAFVFALSFGAHFAATNVLAQAEAEVAQQGFLTPQLDWQPGPAAYPKGATMATLLGEPAKEGPYLVWIKLPGGFEIPPYFHTIAERLTVLSGKLHVGAGDEFDKFTTTPLTAGAHAQWLAGVNHFAWAEGETLIQLHGEGPWVMNYVNPKQDPRHPRQRNVIEHTTDSLEIIKSRVAEGKAVLVDVRSIGEWNTMHLANSTHLPETSLGRGNLDMKKVAEILPAKSEEKILYAYCVVGMRCKKAAKVLQEQGYNVRAVKPGIDEFVEAGFEKAE